MKTNNQQYNSFDFVDQPNAKPLKKSPQVRNPAIGQQDAPTETPIAVGRIKLDPMLTTEQAAAILRVPPDTMKKWRQRPGKGPEFVRYPGGAIRYRLSRIMKFLEDCTVQP